MQIFTTIAQAAVEQGHGGDKKNFPGKKIQSFLHKR